MKYLVTGQEMKLLDQRTSDCFHVPGMVLMEQAAEAFVRELLSCQKEWNHILVLCGPGNNGGDGLAIARLLNQRGYHASVSIINPPKPDGRVSEGTKSFRLQQQIYRAYHYPLIPWNDDSPDSAGQYDLIIDALFGTGLSRDITGAFADVINRVNQLPCARVAVDIASGVSADTGRILGTAFRADRTITFSFGKAGSYLWPGNEYSGEVRVVPMGITEESFLGDRPSFRVLEQKDLNSLLPPRKAHSNKGSYGKVLVIAGSRNMAGAAVFAAKAAGSCGAGLVKVLTPEANRVILQTLVPEAILSVYEDIPGKTQLSDALGWASAVVIGPGLGTSDSAREILRQTLEECSKPLLIDADAINLIAADEALKNLLRIYRAPAVITPHLGEMSRLTGRSVAALQADLRGAAAETAAQYGLTAVLKDFRTVVCRPDGLCYLNLTGNNGMAAGGSGDVLSGVIGALLASGMPAETAAPAGVYIHGCAGDLALPRTGYRGMNANDLINGLKEFWSIHYE